MLIAYKCIKTCFHKDRLYKVGESFSAPKGEKVPEHFVVAEKFKAPPSKKEEVEARTFYEAQQAENKKALKAVGHKRHNYEPEKPLEKDEELFK